MVSQIAWICPIIVLVLASSFTHADPLPAGCEASNVVNLLFAAADGELDKLKKLQESGFDMNSADYDKRTALHLAASENKKDCVEFLLNEAKVMFNPVDRWGNQPIDDAKRYDHKEIITILETAAANAGN